MGKNSEWSEIRKICLLTHSVALVRQKTIRCRVKNCWTLWTLQINFTSSADEHSQHSLVESPYIIFSLRFTLIHYWLTFPCKAKVLWVLLSYLRQHKSQFSLLLNYSDPLLILKDDIRLRLLKITGFPFNTHTLIPDAVPREAQGTPSAPPGRASCLLMGCWRKLIVRIVKRRHIEGVERQSATHTSSTWEANKPLLGRSPAIPPQTVYH